MFWEEWRSLALIIDRISLFKRLSLKRESVFLSVSLSGVVGSRRSREYLLICLCIYYFFPIFRINYCASSKGRI